MVSIHAPRAPRPWLGSSCFNPRAPRGARLQHDSHASQCVLVSIHAPRAGRDPRDYLCHATPSLFQSTRPVRGATRCLQSTCRAAGVSIHAPRAGRDSSTIRVPASASLFQSTRPVRGATRKALESVHNGIVSIHAPRAGRDDEIEVRVAQCSQFQSTRPVRGATACCRTRRFQSTRPVRGATSDAVSKVIPPIKVSIHAPRAGRDLQSQR